MFYKNILLSLELMVALQKLCYLNGFIYYSGKETYSINVANLKHVVQNNDIK